ncbi:hypothetical protein JCM8115_000769 [Rhodotorula mucilaginosa]|uniref:YjgF-like protein n=1 Tax=Rhodotorula mucilaginosa TaxID=5537 RepID=A0A9P6VSS2_RHOMI|nr:hypothetical protein C6P46_001579 [Rhodotorula mucilaginosa]
MSELEYINGPGAGQTWSDLGHYSQAVFLPGNVVKCSGQGGCDEQGNLAGIEWKEQIDKAFENVDRLLQAAGLRGWEDVYSLRSYQVDMGDRWQYIAEKLKTRIPGHRPLWTCLGVARLAFPEMLVELEVEAIKRE